MSHLDDQVHYIVTCSPASMSPQDIYASLVRNPAFLHVSVIDVKRSLDKLVKKGDLCVSQLYYPPWRKNEQTG